MQPGESILIHAGAGGVGQAAITMALHMGCTVFTTVGSSTKRDYIKQRFPKLDDNCIGNSRDISFEQMIMSQTEGRGVDLVLNSLAGKQLFASVRCLAPEGRFLEIGKIDMINNTPLGLGTFMKSRLFTGIALDDVMQFNGLLVKRLLLMVKDGVSTGAVKPIPRQVFRDAEIDRAFKLLATGKHTGKILVKIRNEENLINKPVTALSRIYMHPNKSYVVIGGMGGVGLELTNWLVSKGATKIVLTSRTGIKTGYQKLSLRRWKEKGVDVYLSINDATTPESATKLLEHANALGPVGGLFNLAMVLRDALLTNQSENHFIEVTRSKINTTQNLDIASRRYSSTLDYFVVFSSIVAGRGNIGQSNYGYANSAAECICARRRAEGFPSLAIQWGPIGNVGYFADKMEHKHADYMGAASQSIFSCLQTLELLLHQQHSVVASTVLPDSFKEKRADAKLTPEQAVARFLGVKDLTKISQTATLSEMGLDSLMGAEIKQTLERDYDSVFSFEEVRNLTFKNLHDMCSNTVTNGAVGPSRVQSDSSSNHGTPSEDQIYATSLSI